MNTVLRLSTKMRELEYALMSTESTGLARLPIHLVRIVTTDEEENAWFTIPRPSQQKQAFGHHISVKLDFYKKGMPYFLCVEGEAEIITEIDEIPDTESFQLLRTLIWKGEEAAVKVKITTAEVYGEPVEATPVQAKGIGGVLSTAYDWLFAPVAEV